MNLKTGLREFSALLILAVALGCGRSEIYTRSDGPSNDAGKADGGVAGDAGDAGHGLDAGDAGDGGGIPDAGVDAGGDCAVAIAPAAVDFGTVAFKSSATRQVTLTNLGGATCVIPRIWLGAGSDPLFSLPASQPTSMSLPPGQGASITVSFDASAITDSVRTGSLTIATSDAAHAVVVVPLSATVQFGCILALKTPSLDLGSVTFNLSASGLVILSNTGDQPCQISQLAFAPGSDALFSLVGPQPTDFTIAPNTGQAISVQFDATDSATPRLHQATLTFASNDPLDFPTAAIPLSATINAACVDDSSWIFTLDSDTTLSRFDPVQLTFEDYATVFCGDPSGPNSMAIDMNGVGWAGYHSGALFQIDIATGACQATNFVPGQHKINQFGMEFLFDPSTATDTLYVAGGEMLGQMVASTLATIDMSSLVLTPLGSVSIGFVEPGATPSGQLWGFAPSPDSVNGVPTLAQLDPTNAKVLQSASLSAIPGNGAFAMKYFRGGFFIFDGPSVSRVDLETGALTIEIGPAIHPEKMLRADGVTTREILGAGIAMCPPAP